MIFHRKANKKIYLRTHAHSAVLDPEIKVFKLDMFPTKHLIPKSLKFSQPGWEAEWVMQRLCLSINSAATRVMIKRNCNPSRSRKYEPSSSHGPFLRSGFFTSESRRRFLFGELRCWTNSVVVHRDCKLYAKNIPLPIDQVGLRTPFCRANRKGDAKTAFRLLIPISRYFQTTAHRILRSGILEYCG